MKKRFLLITGLLVLSNEALIAQEDPTGTPPANITGPGLPDVRNNAQRSWYRGGNPNIGNGASNNIFGTLWNSPIYTVTNGVNRMKLNGDWNYPINGVTPPAALGRNGFLLLGVSNNSMTDQQNMFSLNKGAFSMLHLNGEGSQVQELGHRVWMRTGITFTGNQDLSYFGLRQVGNAQDRTETVIAWSDNQSGIADEMAFRFTGAQGSSAVATESGDFADPNDLDGLHVARFTPQGRFGLGNTFGHIDLATSAATHNTPRSLMHLSYQYRSGNANQAYGFMQITYRQPLTGAAIIGQGETENDGLRFGIDNEILTPLTGPTYLSAYLRWQENSPFIVQTDWNNSPGDINNGERMRVSSISAPGVPNPAGLNANTTRVAISANGANPITMPRSLLHLGTNTGNIFTPFETDGWRSWMDVGTFTASGSDNMYVGLKREPGTSNDRQDAVINWGDNQSNVLGAQTGPDNLRFIFTSKTGVGGGDSISQSNDGLEVMRMVPTKATTLPNTNFGMVGIGNFYSANTLAPDVVNAKLDIDGDLRIRTVTERSDLTQVLVIDPNDKNRVHWKTVPTGGGTGSFGVACADNSSASNLAFDSKMNLNNNSFYFPDATLPNTLIENRVSVGYDCGIQLPAKFSSLQQHDALTDQNTIAISAVNTEETMMILNEQIGVQARSQQLQNMDLRPSNIAGDFYAGNATRNFGVRVAVRSDLLNNVGETNIGVYSEAIDLNAAVNQGAFLYAAGANPVGAVCQAWANSNALSFGVLGRGVGSNLQNVGVYGYTWSGFSNQIVLGNQQNIGVAGVAARSLNNIGIYGEAISNPSSISNVAGYFAGNTVTIGSPIIISDSIVKQNISTETQILKRMSALRPVNYSMNQTNYEYLRLADGLQHGFVSQEVENVFPELVTTIVHPAKYDSLGVETSPSTTLKGLNYNGIISLNTQAINELNQKVEKLTLSDESVKSNVVDLNGSLNKVLNMRGVSYDWNHAVHPELNLDSANHIGFIAQEMQQIDSRLTYLADDSLLHVEYDKVVPILAEAIQELHGSVVNNDSIISALQLENVAQQNTINDLNNRLASLENCLSGILPMLCQMSNSSIQPTQETVQQELRTAINVQLSDKNTIILNQNVPNPFAETTVITYSIPATVGKAQIHFYDATGKLINSVDIVERGAGEMKVFANDLSTGIYTYSLVADGVVVSTKRMAKN